MPQEISQKFIPIVLCAGFGTRLKPLTNYIPKVVCPLINKPFAFYNIEKLFQAGFETVHCNTHYLPDIVRKELTLACEYFGYDPKRIRFWHEDNILETGGGIARIFQELTKEDPTNKNKDLLVVSGDIVADFPLETMMQRWKKKKKEEKALLCTKELKEFRKDATFVTLDEGRVEGFGENFFKQNTDKEKMKAKLFSNHQIIDSEVVFQSPIEKKSSIDLFYRPLLAQGFSLINLNYSENLYWFNIGTPAEYREAARYFAGTNPNANSVQIAFERPESLAQIYKMHPDNQGAVRDFQSQIRIGFRSVNPAPEKFFPLLTEEEKSQHLSCFEMGI